MAQPSMPESLAAIGLQNLFSDDWFSLPLMAARRLSTAAVFLYYKLCIYC
ncbi:hypothetical protein J4K00_002973 [Salmonella enterica subsp. enterica serovar 4,[5],12:i:-]|jgi:hypothetical protein|nr:hypothetical protein [Salmonella enterica subsp. enterica serovar 4,[5],12:i:-]